MALFALFTLLLAAAGLVLLVRIFSSFAPNSRKLQQDLDKMKEDMDKWAGDLVPMTREEVDLFSFNQEKHVLRKSFGKTAKGIFTSIYHEPILAYSYKEYIGPGKNALLYVRTGSQEFVYRISKKGIDVLVDREQVGTLKEDGVLYNKRGNRMLAQINREAGEFLPVLVNDREVANVARLKKGAGSKLSQRAFEFVKDDMSKEEKDVFLSLAVLEVIEQSINQ
ncbi:MAG: hypothetical protein H6573_25830 [Lewinellaceae bacterium]|nr:hypothetical protein [Phaeodactylibacter sp.]MCB9350896.1 hypothetical protein [Lewinellaceae bacterium]